jgi:SNF family Na+-dependent transporter
MFDAVTKGRIAKYFGTIGILGPFIILIYYMYIESWSLAYAIFSFTGDLFQDTTAAGMEGFLGNYLGMADGASILPAYIFFIITFFVNFFFIYRGVQGGIEKLSRFGMPILLILAVFLAIRVLTLGTPNPALPDLSVNNALGFVWNPDFSALTDANVWLEAAGQIFFTMSVGIGVILTYASYLKKNEDVALSGLTAGATNEFCEVILGGSIVIPAAFLFLGGASGAVEVAESGTFNIGFVTMPLIFSKIPLGFLFSGMWFLLLFIAGVTSSVSLIQPAISFLEDEFELSRRKSTFILGAIAFLGCQPAIFCLKYGFVDELDFWAGTFFLVLFATVEIILFAWIFGMDRGWKEIHLGANIRVPLVYKYIIKFVTPLYLLLMWVFWSKQKFWPVIKMEGVLPENKPYILGARLMILGLWILCGVLVAILWKNRKKEVEQI